MQNKHWEIKTLGDVSEVIAGQSPKGIYYNTKQNGLAFYQGKKEFGDKFIKLPKVWTTKVTKIAEKGDILMSVRAPVGPTNIATEKICIGRGLAAIRVGKDLDKEYLYYFFKHFQDSIQGNEGAVFNSINKTQIEDIEILTPGLAEQKRIVGILDEKFKAIEELKKVTEAQIQDVKELFESRLLEIFLNPPTDWTPYKLHDVASVTMGQSPPGSTYNIKNEGLPLINGPVEFGPGQLDETHVTKYTTRPTKVCNAGELLVCVRGSTTGRTNIAKCKSCIGRGVASIVPDERLVDKDLFHIYIASLRNQIYKMGKGATFPNVNREQINDIELAFPKLEKQKNFNDELSQLLKDTKELELIFRKKVTFLEELKKSYLEEAFAGKL